MIPQATQLSIVIPTYNRQGYLAECLESLLEQQCGGYELLIRDNCSTDNTEQVYLKYKSRFEQIGVCLSYKKNEYNQGFRDNMVFGLKELHRAYALILMDDDFFIGEHALFQLYCSIADNQQTVLSTCGVAKCFVDEQGKTDLQVEKHLEDFPAYQVISGTDYFLNAMNYFKPLVLSAVIFDRELLLQSPWERWSQRAALDVNMYNILSLKGDVALFSAQMSAYRIHAGQDFNTIPLQDAFASHSQIQNWHSLAAQSGKLATTHLWWWRIKTIILKDEGIVRRFQERGRADLSAYFNWLKQYKFSHYLLMRLFMPCCIRYSRQKQPEWLNVPLANIRRWCLRLFLHLYRKKFQPNYSCGITKALKG